MRKQALGILLLLSLILPVLIAYSILKVQKKQIKHEVKWKMIDGLDRSELVLLAFTSTEAKHALRWEHSREFEYNDQMYDVVEQTSRGDSIFYWCWWDHEETELNKKLQGLLSIALGQIPERKQKQEGLARLFKTLYLTQIENYSALLPVRKMGNKTVFFHWNNLFLSPPTPPPQLTYNLVVVEQL